MLIHPPQEVLFLHYKKMVSLASYRQCISRGLSVKYLTEDGVIDYIKQHQLYTELE